MGQTCSLGSRWAVKVWMFYSDAEDLVARRTEFQTAFYYQMKPEKINIISTSCHIQKTLQLSQFRESLGRVSNISGSLPECCSNNLWDAVEISTTAHMIFWQTCTCSKVISIFIWQTVLKVFQRKQYTLG